jgi:hypothetical protein
VFRCCCNVSMVTLSDSLSACRCLPAFYADITIHIVYRRIVSGVVGRVWVSALLEYDVY